MRALRVAGNLRLFPGAKLGIDFLGGILHASFETGDLVGGVDALVFGRELLQLVDLGLEVRDWLFEIEISLHEIRLPVVLFKGNAGFPFLHGGL